MVYSVTELSSEIKTILLKNKNELNFSYDYSIFQENKNLIIIGAFFKKIISNENLKNKFNEIKKIKIANQDYAGASSGCLFKNYLDKDLKRKSTGELLDKLGFKNYQIGMAKVSSKHANFILNVHPLVKEFHSIISEKNEKKNA